MLFFTMSRQEILSTFEVKELMEDQTELLQLAAEWHHDKWGHIHSPGRKLGKQADVEERKKHIINLTQNPHHFYIVSCRIMGKPTPVGMFALKAHNSFLEKITITELDDVYIDRRFRALGLGGNIIKSAKIIATEKGYSSIILDTLNPNLNRFYEKNGARCVAEGRCNGFPTEKLVITLQEKNSEISEEKRERDRRRVSMK
jgi:GNAT superfamily N-acetyltransferase